MAEAENNQAAAPDGTDRERDRQAGEQPAKAGAAPPAVPAQGGSHSSRRSIHAGLRLGVLALAVAALWWLVWSLGLPDPRNTPERLLAQSSRSTAIDLSAISELKTNLSAEDLAFGELQIERMLRDRPEMTRYAGKTDPVWEFCARSFAGAAIGERIYWESSLPVGGEYRSEHQEPYKGRPAFIRIRKDYGSGYLEGSPLPCEELWSCAVFEIENLRNHGSFTTLFELALQGKLSREQWIREHTRLEYSALRRTAAQYQKLWRPRAEARGIPTSGDYWGTDVPTTYESWISLYRDPKSYPWNVYGRWYDQEILPCVRWSKR